MMRYLDIPGETIRWERRSWSTEVNFAMKDSKKHWVALQRTVDEPTLEDNIERASFLKNGEFTDPMAHDMWAFCVSPK